MRFSFFNQDIAVDLGTATTLVYIKGKGVVLREPSVVAVDRSSGRVIAVGSEAKRMLGKTPDTVLARRPMKDGVIADFALVQEMLYTFLVQALKRSLLVRPRVLVAVPSGITEVEMRAVREAAENAGAREVPLVHEPIAAAVGIDLPIEEPTGNMIVDIGGGTTEIAVISLSGIVTSRSIKVAGDEMDEAIVNYVRRRYNVLIGEQTAERIKMEIGNVAPVQEEDAVLEVRGRDLVTGIPKTVEIHAHEIRPALMEPVKQIIQGVRETLEQTPPELAADIIDRGIYLAGGGALLRGLDTLISNETGLPVEVVDNPIECVVLGAGKILEDLKRYEKVLLRPRKSGYAR